MSLTGNLYSTGDDDDDDDYDDDDDDDDDDADKGDDDYSGDYNDDDYDITRLKINNKNNKVINYSAYFGSQMSSEVGRVEDNGSFQGRGRYQCSLVDLSVKRQHDIEPRSIVFLNVLVLNATLEGEIGEVVETLITERYGERSFESRDRHARI